MAETEGTPSTSTANDADASAAGAGTPATTPPSSAPAAPAVVTVIKPNEVVSAVAKAGEVSGTDATRAALRRTLQQGVGFASSPQSSNPPERAAGELFDQARRAAALADTQQDLTRPPPGSTKPPRASRNPKLAQTLRMDLKLPPAEEAPVETVSSTPPASGRSSPRPHIPTQHGVPLPPIQTPELSSTRPNFSVGPQTRPAEAVDPFDPGAQRSYIHDPSTSGPRIASPVPPALPRSKRPLRPGERTMVLSRRVPARKDWLFVVLVVGALGVTASMLLSYRSSGEEESAEAVPEEEEVAEDPSQPTAAAPEQAQPASSSVRATELRSEPAGAEVVVNGAVVGNTPVRVARSDSDVDYTLRLPGYESKVVRVGSQSPATIAVTLRPNNPPPVATP